MASFVGTMIKKPSIVLLELVFDIPYQLMTDNQDKPRIGYVMDLSATASTIVLSKH
jgi:hypothetical protein